MMNVADKLWAWKEQSMSVYNSKLYVPPQIIQIQLASENDQQLTD